MMQIRLTSGGAMLVFSLALLAGCTPITSVGYAYYVDAKTTVFQYRRAGARAGGNLWRYRPGRPTGL